MELVQLNALEVSILVGEVRKVLSGGIVRNAYQPSGASVALKVSAGGGTLEFWAVAGECIFYTDLEVEKPSKPTPFATFLRRSLNGLRVMDVIQMESERVVKVVFGDGSKEMVVEMMPSGNIFILKNRRINRAMRAASGRARLLGPGDEYVPPQPRYSYMPGDAGPTLLSKLRADSPVVSALSRDLGLGGKFAEELLARASVDKRLKVENLSETQRDELLRALAELEVELQKPRPGLYRVGSSAIPSPIPLQHIHADYVETSSFSEAVAHAYLIQRGEEMRREAAKPLLDKLRELERSVSEKVIVLEGLRDRERRLGEALRILDTWADRLSTPDYLEGSGIEVEYDGRVTEVRVAGEKFRLREGISIRRQISQQYDELKKIRETIRKLEEKKSQILSEIEDVRRRIEMSQQHISSGLERYRRRPASGQRLREFTTSDGFKVVSGRDARTNIQLLRNMMEPRDLVLHADIPGSPVTLVRRGSEAPYSSLEEGAQFTACYSRAWREGFTSASIYYVEPSQISLSAPSGEYLARGSFMVYGKRRYIEVQLRLAVCEDGEGGVILIPQLTASRMGLRYVELRPGMTESMAAAREILNHITTPLLEGAAESLASRIPFGRCSIYLGDKLIRT